MNKDFLPMSAVDVHDSSIDALIVEGIMSRDFGPWKKGENRVLTFDFERGTCTEYNDIGSALSTIPITIVEAESNKNA